jgi:hypothetical protein
MQNPYPFENNENIAQTPEITFFNDSLYESESAPVLLTHSTTQTFQPTLHMNPQPNDILLTCQKMSNSIKALKKNARKQQKNAGKQLKQADELEVQLSQLEQFLNQQSPMSRRINRNRVHRSHPYNDRSLVSLTSTIQPAAPTDRRDEGFVTEQDILSNSFHPQHANVPAATTDFPDNNESRLSSSSQNFEFFNGSDTTYNERGF